MQHDKRMADDNAYVEALERQALASEEDNIRLRAEIAAVRIPGPSLSVDPTTQADTRAQTDTRRSKPSWLNRANKSSRTVRVEVRGSVWRRRLVPVVRLIAVTYSL